MDLKPGDKGPWKGGRASTQAATRVKPEQAPRGLPWTPTQHHYGEGHAADVEESTERRLVHRGNGRGMRTRCGAQHGRPGPNGFATRTRRQGVVTARSRRGPWYRGSG